MTQESSKPTIFISHRSTDKPIAEMLFDFLVETGIPSECIFCSSLPGNDVRENIPKEIKQNLKSGVVNIAILSNDYFASPYCLNEEGILWYCDTPVIPIALPEINPKNLIGFLGSDFKLRRLDNNEDVSYIFTTIREKLNIPSEKDETMIVTVEMNKLIEEYKGYLGKKSKEENQPIVSTLPSAFYITTDDERIVLYYVLKKRKFSFSTGDIDDWLIDKEIFDVDVDNAFNIFNASNYGSYSKEKQLFTFNIDFFRKCTENSQQLLDYFNPYVEKHYQPRDQFFLDLWNKQDGINSAVLLFLCYFIENKISFFGTLSLEAGCIKDIEQWESDNSLVHYLSKNYHDATWFFIEKDLAYLYEDPLYQSRGLYTLYPSLEKLLLNCPEEIKDRVIEEKMKYTNN